MTGRPRPYRLAERVDLGDLLEPARGWVEEIFFSTGPTVGPSCPCWAARVEADSFLTYSSVLNGSGVRMASLDAFEREYLPVLLENQRCSVVRVRYKGRYNETWLYLRGETVEEAGQSALAASVIES